MDIKQMRKEITELIDSIKEHSDELTGKPHIPLLEFELILAKVEKLYKQMVLFNHYYSMLDNPAELNKQEQAATTSPAEEKAKGNIQRSWPNLKNLIDINQKFQFISELFKGNASEFNEAVDKINSLYNKEEALIYVTGLGEAFAWKKDSPVAETFIRIVMNRYQ